MSVDLPGLDALVKKILEQESYRDSIRQINMVVKTIELQLAKKEIKLISVNFLEARGFGLKYKNGKFNIIRSDYAKNKSGELSYIRSDLNNLGKIDSMRINHFATEFEELIQI